ncbi:MAG: hypothetical protein R3E39_11195 [Anaerolineae bacterium]
MKLPNLDQAYVPPEKLTDYLLSEENSSGKSGFFAAFGFSIMQPDRLREALLLRARTHEVIKFSETAHGIKFIIDGELQAPDRRTPYVRSIWIIDIGKTKPRFVTAYPLKGGKL